MAARFSITLSLYMLFITVLFCCGPVLAHDIKYCDSLIQSGMDAMAKKDHVKSLELLTEARDLAEKNHWYKQLFLATNNMGGNYYRMMDYGEALSQYQKSYKIAIEHLDSKQEMAVLNNIAVLYIRDAKPDRAKEYLDKALHIARKNNDSIKIGYYSINLGTISNETGEFSQGRKYLYDAIAHLKKQPEGIFMARIVLCENDMLIGDTKIARQKAELLLKGMEQENQEYLINLSSIIAKSYLKENNPKSALLWINRALGASPDLEMKTELFSLLADTYFRLDSHALAFQYKDSVMDASNKLNKLKNSQLFEASAVKVQLQDYKREIANKDARILYERKLFYAIVIVGIVVIFFLLVTFRNQRIKNSQNRLLAKSNQDIIELKLQKEIDDNLLSKKKEEIALLEQQRLKKEIDLKNQKISAKALFTSGRNQLLEELLKSLSTEPELIINKNLVKHVRALKSHIRTDNDWEDFIIHFEEVNQGFLKKLKSLHPELTTNDIRYISYVYMNLSTKEIAAMLNITIDACKKRKMRISEKLGLEDGIGLLVYLSSI